jgi:hypothetical protein
VWWKVSPEYFYIGEMLPEKNGIWQCWVTVFGSLKATVQMLDEIK